MLFLQQQQQQKRQQEPIPNPSALQLRFQNKHWNSSRGRNISQREPSTPKKKKKKTLCITCVVSLNKPTGRSTRANVTCGSVNVVSRACWEENVWIVFVYCWMSAFKPEFFSLCQKERWFILNSRTRWHPFITDRNAESFLISRLSGSKQTTTAVCIKTFQEEEEGKQLTDNI